MIIVVALAVLWASYEVAKRLRVRVEGVEPGDPGAGAGAGAGRSSRRASSSRTAEDAGSTVTWSALDDHQLTRLLVQSASNTTTETHDDLTER